VSVVEVPILVDSAIYIDRLRAGEDLPRLLLPQLKRGMLYNCGVVRAEVIRGVKNLRVKTELNDFFNIKPEVPTKARIWQKISELAWTLDRTVGGHRPLTELVIAQCAIHVGAVLVSPDAHFRDIPGLIVRETL
jgi:predicted nucleic acid-binding protein